MLIRVTADIVYASPFQGKPPPAGYDRFEALCTTAIYGRFTPVYAMIKAFKLIIYHVVLPRTKDSDGFI